MLSADETALLLRTVARFVDREVVPAASALEHRNEYPTVLVDRMKEIGLFGMNVPEDTAAASSRPPRTPRSSKSWRADG